MAKLLCICGKIGCGKTYYANRLKEQEHAVILSTDEVTYDLTNNQQGDGYDEFAIRVNLYLRKKAVEIVNAGCTVILDWGFWTKENRKEIKRYGRRSSKQESRRGQEEKTHLSEEYSGWRHSGYRFFPPSNEVAGTYHGIHHLLHP